MSGQIPDLKARVRLDTSDVDRGATSALGSVKKMVGGAIVAFAGFKIAGFLKESIVGFANLESDLGALKVTLGASSSEMEKLKDKAVALGNDLTLPGVGAKDASDAMNALSMSGMSLNDTMKASKPVLQIAKLANLDYGTSARIITGNLNAFGLESKDATRVVDVLTNTMRLGGAPLGELSQGFEQVGAVAKLFGFSLEETATSLAVLNKAGIRGSDAGTSLKTMFVSLAKPSKEAGELMKKFGFSATDATGNFKPMKEIVENLKTSFSGLSEEQKTNALTTIFGTDALRAAGILAETGGEQFGKLEGEVKRTGIAQETLKAKNEGVKGSWDALSSTVETFGLLIGEKTAPAIKGMLDGVSSGLDEIKKFFSTLGEEGKKFYNNNKETFDEIGAKAKEAFEKVKTFISDTLAEAKKWWNENKDEILEALETIAGLVERTLERIEKFWDIYGKNIMASVRNSWNFIKGIYNASLGMLIGQIQFFLAILTGDWKGAWDGIKNYFENVWKGIKTVFFAIKDGIVNIFSTIGATIKAGFVKAIDVALAVIQKMLGVLGKIPFFGGPFKEASKNVKDLREELNKTDEQISRERQFKLEADTKGAINDIGVMGTKLDAVTGKEYTVSTYANTAQTKADIGVMGTYTDAVTGKTRIVSTYANTKPATDNVAGAGSFIDGVMGRRYSATVGANANPARTEANNAVAEINRKKAEIYVSANVSGIGAKVAQAFANATANLPRKAVGGSVTGGSPYIIGEKGRELFIPNVSGRIVPNHQLTSSNTKNNNFNIVVNAKSEFDIMSGLARATRLAGM